MIAIINDYRRREIIIIIIFDEGTDIIVREWVKYAYIGIKGEELIIIGSAGEAKK